MTLIGVEERIVCEQLSGEIVEGFAFRAGDLNYARDRGGDNFFVGADIFEREQLLVSYRNIV
jgi:hypothetical protein